MSDTTVLREDAEKRAAAMAQTIRGLATDVRVLSDALRRIADLDDEGFPSLGQIGMQAVAREALAAVETARAARPAE